MNESDTVVVLSEYFNIEDKETDWHIHCKACPVGWALKKGSFKPGNILKLLDHAYSHKEHRDETHPS